MAKDLVHIKIPEPLKKELRERAERNHRSMAGEACYLIEQAIGLEDSGQARELRASLEEARA
jgi:plasmid stability protein